MRNYLEKLEYNKILELGLTKEYLDKYIDKRFNLVEVELDEVINMMKNRVYK